MLKTGVESNAESNGTQSSRALLLLTRLVHFRTQCAPSEQFEDAHVLHPQAESISQLA